MPSRPMLPTDRLLLDSFDLTNIRYLVGLLPDTHMPERCAHLLPTRLYCLQASACRRKYSTIYQKVITYGK
jgi:hypothetical protein